MKFARKRSIRTAYFDTNVYTRFYKRDGITEAGLQTLRTAVRSHKVSILLSETVLDETLSALKSNPDEALGRLEFTFDVSRWTQLIKSPADLLEGEIRAYAAGRPSPSPFQSVDSKLRGMLMNQDPESRAGLLSVIRDEQDGIQKFKNELQDIMDSKIAPLVKKVKEQNLQQSFQEYMNVFEPEVAKSLADLSGCLEECLARGIQGLMSLRPVRICTYANISTDYARTYEGRSVNRGDSRDMHHAVLSSAAEVFITNDQRLIKTLMRDPPTGFEVMDPLTFLSQL